MTLLDALFIGGVALIAAALVGFLGLLEGYLLARRDARQIERITRGDE